jgi:hypothetical protein
MPGYHPAFWDVDEPMNTAIMTWLAFRALRWLCWIGLIVYSVQFLMDRSAYQNSFGQLLLSTEVWMFGLGLGALFAGYLELMMRERTGLDRPSFGRLIPPAAPTAKAPPIR